MQDAIKYLRIIRRWWWITALLFVVTVGTLLGMALLTPPEYQASVTVQVSAPPPQEAPLYSDFGRQAVGDEIYRTQSSFSQLLQFSNVANMSLDQLPDVILRGEELRDRITVEIPEDSQLMHVYVRAGDPDTAALLANKVVEVGLQRYGELQAQPTSVTRQFIEEQIELARKEMETAEAELTQFQIDNKVGQLDRVIDKQYDVVRNLKTERDLTWASGDMAKTEAIDKIVLEREAELQNMLGISAEYSGLNDRVNRARQNLSFLLDRWTEAQIKENQIRQVSSVQVITPARPPRNPVAAIDSRFIVLGGLLSLVGGILLSFVLEYGELSTRSRLAPVPAEVAQLSGPAR